MTKKRLSDLLREEITKDTENEAVVTTPTETEETPKTTTSKSRRTTPSAQDKKVVELSEALALATKQVNTLQTQAKSLETELEIQKSLVQTLQKQLEQQTLIESALKEQKTLSTHLSTQLDEAQTELEAEKQLVEKLYVELQKIQLKPLTEPQPEPLKPPEPPEPPEPSPPPQPLVVKKVQSYQIKPRFVAPSSSTAHLSNDDIGWFD